MNPTPFPSTVAAVIAAVGAALAAVSPALPAVLQTPAAILGMLLAGLGGSAVKPPYLTDGKPVLQGLTLTIATGILGALTQFWFMIPAGWPQSVALSAAALLAFLTGKAMPALGSVSKEQLDAAAKAGEVAAGAVANKAAALDVINGGR